MGLEEVIDLTITTGSVMPSRAGFGTPLFVVYETVTPNLVTLYRDLPSMISDGFALTDPAYLMASKALSQNPRPQIIAIGKRTRAFTQVLNLVPTKTTVGYTYSFTFVSPLGVKTPIQYVVQTSDTVAIIAAALVALFSGVVGVTAATVGSPVTSFTLTAAVGKIFNLTGLPNPSILKITDTTTDPGIAADLTDIEAFDNTSWYGITFDHTGKLETLAAAAWVESRRRIALFNTSDEGTLNSGVTTDVATALDAFTYARSEIFGSYGETQSYSATGWMSEMLTFAPGSATWAFKQIVGVAADKLTGTQKLTAVTKNVNTYTPLAKIPVTQWGSQVNGGYTDIVVGTDWLFARIQEDLFILFTQNAKIPYTDSGVGSVKNVVLGRLISATKPPNSFLASSPAPTVFFPKVADVDITDRQNRLLPNGTFTATMTGAIHKVQLTGSLSF